MKKIIKVLSYSISSYILFLISIYILNTNAKFVNWSDLKNAEDWFYFFWLFGVPLLIDIIILGLPIFFGIRKIHLVRHKGLIYLVIICAFALDFLFANSIYENQLAISKLIISTSLFFLFFWKEFFITKVYKEYKK